jgi:hypothetical protein
MITVLDAIIEFLKGRFGENNLMRWGMAGSLILAMLAVYVFFIKESAYTFDKYYDYKLSRCADAALTTAQIANSDDEKVIRNAIRRFDELY